MLGTELLCEPLLLGGLPLSCCPLPLGTGVEVGVRLLPICVGLAEGAGDGVAAVVGVGDGVVAVVGDGVGVTGVGVGDGVGVGVAVHFQETWTEFAGPVKVIVSFAGQGTLEGIVIVTETCALG